jgi:hypothetical protein
MIEGHRSWIDLLNAHGTWVTDASMLGVLPEEFREFESAPEWSKGKALAYLHNNVSALRLNYDRLEAGEMLDLDLLNPVLDSMRLRFVDWRRHADYAAMRSERGRRGDRLLHLQPGLFLEGFNKGSAHIRFLVHRAVYHFCRYADIRLADPSYPSFSQGMVRVTCCAAARCQSLVWSPGGFPIFCSPPCAEETGVP